MTDNTSLVSSTTQHKSDDVEYGLLTPAPPPPPGVQHLSPTTIGPQITVYIYVVPTP